MEKVTCGTEATWQSPGPAGSIKMMALKKEEKYMAKEEEQRGRTEAEKRCAFERPGP